MSYYSPSDTFNAQEIVSENNKNENFTLTLYFNKFVLFFPHDFVTSKCIKTIENINQLHSYTVASHIFCYQIKMSLIEVILYFKRVSNSPARGEIWGKFPFCIVHYIQ